MDIAEVIVLIFSLGVLAQWLAWRAHIPAIVLFAAVGLIIGPIAGVVNPSLVLGDVFRPVVSLCVAVILFEGGLNLHWHELSSSASGVKRLVTVAAVLSFALGSIAAHWVGGLELPVAMVFGAIIVVTGPTVIMPLLRQSHLNRRTASYLKWEGIINDPIGALAAVLIFQVFVLSDQSGHGGLLSGLLIALGSGIGLGGGAAWLLGRAFNNGTIPEYLKAPCTLATVLVVYTLSNHMQHEAGLLAVTVMGLWMGNMDLPSMGEMRRFKEYITLMLVSSVFVMLSADIDRDILNILDWHAVALILALMFIVRPAAVLIATIWTDMRWSERILVAWIAPRGIVATAVAGVFGPDLVAAGYEDGALLAPLMFALVFATVISHGFSIGWLARRLDLTVTPNTVLIVGASPWTTALAQTIKNDLGSNIILVDSSWHRLREARLNGIPVQYGEILSEELQQGLELGSVNCLLAATSNDAYNALVCRHFSQELGPDRVFQLPMYAAEESHKRRKVAKPLTGVMAFSEDSQYEELWRRHFQGWSFSKTRITSTYDWENFLADVSGESIPIGVVKDGRRMIFHAPLNPIRPQPGDTVVYYAPPESKPIKPPVPKKTPKADKESSSDGPVPAEA
ncbi:sodium/hydrogen exchanger [Oceanococcus atlanticus]|uniref:Sodium/hydrogen exchanger n=1 Tax=Oceanococcus atlanticus TaxID=1317117 RepID=A0A1Y1SFH8_9GAMM|nr:sodium:proton antiporter [Oceanococcus atlanticus]ORE87444.1 sodium/hydrogen exchanger [Oceanococcus atlanticus]RZO87188.1 MAG: sodium:proton antiporter [Oceanococcus sp.]